jgi:hypothetical protein
MCRRVWRAKIAQRFFCHFQSSRVCLTKTLKIRAKFRCRSLNFSAIFILHLRIHSLQVKFYQHGYQLQSNPNAKLSYFFSYCTGVQDPLFLALRGRVARISDRHQGCLKASDCGRLGRQAAGHPWSALRVVKSCRKDYPMARVLLKAKAAALHPERYQSLLSKLSTKRKGEAGKRSAGNRIS